MTEMVSNVYDLVYPSPASLKEISSGALVTAVWRWEIENRTNDDFNEFISELDLCKNLPPNLPSHIKRMIEVYSARFISYIKEWLCYHYMQLFQFHRSDEFHILHDFYDFICTWFCRIDFHRTAKRMMMCDRLSNDEKFKIASMYCFEDDIVRLWPSVSEKLDLSEIDFYENPELFYWICMRRNEPHRIPNFDNDPIDGVMLQACQCPFNHWSSILYFWNRIRPESQLMYAIYLSQRRKTTFVRFILPTLSNQTLDQFVAEQGSHLMYALLTNSLDKLRTIPMVWTYIKNKMNENNFSNLIELLVHSETNCDIFGDLLIKNDPQLEDWSTTRDKTYLSCEIWRNSPDKLKRSAIKHILTRDQLFIGQQIKPAEFKGNWFLWTVLSDASFEERNAFWLKNWRYLMAAMRVEDLQRIMELCFKDDNDITRFKKTFMAEYGNIGSYCCMLMYLGYFKELNDVLIFCCADTNKRKNIKQLVVQSCFFDESSIMRDTHLTGVELMNELINDASSIAEIAVNYKNEFASFRRIRDVLRQCILSSYECASDHLINFIETLVQTEEVTVTIKQDILNYVRDFLNNGNIMMASVRDLQTILLWCLGNDDQVTNFKQSLSINDVFRRVRGAGNLSELKTRYTSIGEFLKWYFRTPEDIAEFERGFDDQSNSNQT